MRRGRASGTALDVAVRTPADFVRKHAAGGQEVKGQVHEFLRSFCQSSKYIFQAGGSSSCSWWRAASAVSLEREDQ